MGFFCQGNKENSLALSFVLCLIHFFFVFFAVCLSQCLICQVKGDTEIYGNITTSKLIIYFKALVFILGGVVCYLNSRMISSG